MNHKTVWYEFQTGSFRCDGCAVQCQTCGNKPKDNMNCDGSIEQIRRAIFNKEVSNCSETQQIGGA